MALERIPLFPLHTVLFPGAPLSLHVFEPRYRTMMAEVLGEPGDLRHDPAFGVACIREGLEVGARADTFAVGCLGVVTAVERSEDGTLDIVVRGTRRFSISGRPSDDPYPQADVEFLTEPVGPARDEALRLATNALDRYVAAAARLGGREARGVRLPEDVVAASYTAAAALGVEPARLQQLLEAATASDRLARVATIARSEAAILDTIGPPVQAPHLRGITLN